MFTKQLIDAVREHECLYNRRIPSYKRRINKIRAWQSVAAMVDSDVDTCQKKWRTLRDCFHRELSRLPNSKEPWRHFHDMMFLQEHVYINLRRNKYNPEFIDITANNTSTDLDEEKYKVCLVSDGDTDVESNQQSDSVDHLQTEELEDTMDEIQEEEPSNQSVDLDYSQSSSRSRSVSKPAEKPSRNIHFLKLLDEYLVKLPDDVQDELKVQILNLVFEKVMSAKRSGTNESVKPK